PGDLQRARPAGAAVFPGQRGQGDVSAGPDLPRLGPPYHRDVADRQTRRRDHRLPGAAARPLGTGRRLRSRDGRTAARDTVDAPAIGVPRRPMAACWTWVALAAARSRAR